MERAGFPPKLPRGNFAERSPGASDPVVPLDSTPVEAGRSADTPGPGVLAEAAGMAIAGLIHEYEIAA